jgi:hypothetical protein
MRKALRVLVPDHLVFAAMLIVLGVTVPTPARAQNVCNGLINLNYVSGPMRNVSTTLRQWVAEFTVAAASSSRLSRFVSGA